MADVTFKPMFQNKVGQRYLSAAEGFDHAIGEAIRPIFEAWFKQGYSTRDLGALCHWVVFDIEIDTRLGAEMGAISKEPE